MSFKSTTIALTLLLAAATQGAHTPLDIQTSNEGVKILKNHSATPDSKGIMDTFSLNLPEFTRAVYYCTPWWPYGGNRVSGRQLTKPSAPEGGIFLLLELKDGGYLTVLPLSGDKAYSWFAPDGDRFILKFGTHGKDAILGDFPLVAWASGTTPYEACSKVWTAATETLQIKGHLKLRNEKPYPEMFRYLGWCSWEEFYKNISSEKLAKQMKGLVASSAPIRYMLVDDGHFNPQSTAPKKNTFPDGYKPLTDLRTADGIRWVGMWYALMGESTAILPPGQLGEASQYMMTAPNGTLVAKPDPVSIEGFLRHMFKPSERDDIDFLKVDFSGGLLARYAGTTDPGVLAGLPDNTNLAIGNPIEATVHYARLYQQVTEDLFDGLMNCNWQQQQFLFNTGNSSVGRCSADYSKGNLKKAKSHLYDSYATTPWLGQIAWGDHDMFHSNEKFAGRMMAISKAMSAGPVYLSDPYDHFDLENINPLCYEDGLLLRPLAPATPLPEDLFHAKTAKRLYRVIAPLKNQSVAIAIYNFHGDAKEDNPKFTTTIVPADYAAGGSMIQPYAGEWQLPAEGLVVYDYYKKTAEKLTTGYDVSIKGFGDHLLQMSPIENGWSVIGRIDKYLPSAAVESVVFAPESILVNLHEQGPFGIWLDQGKPMADGLEFMDKGNGFFTVDMPAKPEPVELSIKRK